MSHAPDWKNRIVRSGEMTADEFVPHELNARRHPRSQRDALVGSLDAVGIVARVIRSARSGKLLDGHARIEEAVARNPQQLIPFDEVDVSAEEERTILATFDPITGLATYDPQSLDVLLDGLVTGSDALDELVKELANNNRALPQAGGGGDEFDTTPAQGEAQTKRGDVYVIDGKHRVMCGDATSAEDVAVVMDEKKCDAVLTDPPYGINQDGVTHDEPEKLTHIVQGAIQNLPLNNGVVVAFQSTRTFPVWLDGMRSAGFHFERILSLYKEAQCTFPWRGWILISESILIASKGECHWNDVHPYSHDAYKVPEVSHELSDAMGWHGAVKPIAVVQDIAKRITRTNDVLFDPFLGSGTTLIAAHRENRTCYGMEIDPHYCDVIVRRAEAEGLKVERA